MVQSGQHVAHAAADSGHTLDSPASWPCRSPLVSCLGLAAAGGSAKDGRGTYRVPEQLVWYVSYGQDTLDSPTHHQGLADVYSVGICLWKMLVGRDPLRRVLRYEGLLSARSATDRDSLRMKQQLVSLAVPCLAYHHN